ncbi:MAG: hypothetical protein U1D55_02665 [Phycisphaerae bacterium]
MRGASCPGPPRGALLECSGTCAPTHALARPRYGPPQRDSKFGVILRGASLRDLIERVGGLAVCCTIVMSMAVLRFRK